MQDIELWRRYPRCYHLAYGPSVWASMQAHGLLSVAAILRRREVDESLWDDYLESHRGTTVTLERPDHGAAFLRDQHPLNVKMLERALTDMTVPEWLEQLNRHVFFSPTAKRLNSLYAAYSMQRRLVIRLDTRELLDAHRFNIRLSALNTGAVRHVSHVRGSDTLKRVSLFDSRREVAEIAVVDGVPDLMTLHPHAEVWYPDGSRVSAD